VKTAPMPLDAPVTMASGFASLMFSSLESYSERHDF
jgi:hypothetical protein